MPWTPEPDFDNFLKSMNPEAVFSYDPESITELSGQDSNSRYAGHCLIWAKTNKVFECRKKDIPLIAFINVSYQTTVKPLLCTRELLFFSFFTAGIIRGRTLLEV